MGHPSYDVVAVDVLNFSRGFIEEKKRAGSLLICEPAGRLVWV
jgi:hypothetical protein